MTRLCVETEQKHLHVVSIFDFVIIALNVDHIVWFSRNTKVLEEEKLALAKRFKVEVDLHYSTMFLVCLLNGIEDQEHFR